MAYALFEMLGITAGRALLLVANPQVLSSIAYTDVADSPVADMFEQSRREYVADIINRSLFYRCIPAKEEGDDDHHQESKEKRGDRDNDDSATAPEQDEQQLRPHSSAEVCDVAAAG